MAADVVNVYTKAKEASTGKQKQSAIPSKLQTIRFFFSNSRRMSAIGEKVARLQTARKSSQRSRKRTQIGHH